MSDCTHKKYMTSIGAKDAIRKLGWRVKPGDVLRCPTCNRWRVREGML